MLRSISSNARYCRTKQYKQLYTEESFYIWQTLREGALAAQMVITLGRYASIISRRIRNSRSAQAIKHTDYWAMQLCKY